MTGGEEKVSLRLTGLVQGVGMRHFVYRSAQRAGLKGFVKNLPDGSVQCVLQGDSKSIQELINLLESSPVGRVDRVLRSEAGEDMEYSTFTIEY